LQGFREVPAEFVRESERRGEQREVRVRDPDREFADGRVERSPDTAATQHEAQLLPHRAGLLTRDLGQGRHHAAAGPEQPGPQRQHVRQPRLKVPQPTLPQQGDQAARNEAHGAAQGQQQRRASTAQQSGRADQQHNGTGEP
jgi:hypothetical protein